MNDEVINKLLSQGLCNSRLDSALEHQLLEQSSQILLRTCLRRIWIGRACYGGGVLLALLLGLLGGHCSHTSRSQLATDTNETNTVQVSKDMVNWLEAGRLFTCLALEQRATFAYEQASRLASSAYSEQPVTRSLRPVRLTQSTHQLAKLLTSYEASTPRRVRDQKDSIQRLDTYSLLATVIGE